MEQYLISRGSISLRTTHGKFLSAQPSGSMEANRPQAQGWEFFQVMPSSRPGAICLRSAHGKYLCAEPSGAVVVNRDVPKEWESFNVQQMGPDQVAFRSYHGKFLCVEPNGNIICNRDRPQAWETFYIGGGGGMMPGMPHPPHHPGHPHPPPHHPGMMPPGMYPGMPPPGMMPGMPPPGMMPPGMMPQPGMYPGMMPPPPQGNGLRWQPAQGSMIPPNAVQGGNEPDGKPLFIGRANYNGGLVLGKVAQHLNAANQELAKKTTRMHFGFGGKEEHTTSYEVLVSDFPGMPIQWVRISPGMQLNYGACGREPNGQPLWVARAPWNGSLTPGKFGNHLGRAFVAFGNQEHPVDSFEVLYL